MSKNVGRERTVNGHLSLEFCESSDQDHELQNEPFVVTLVAVSCNTFSVRG
jgi:hypothetical protein